VSRPCPSRPRLNNLLLISVLSRAFNSTSDCTIGVFDNVLTSLIRFAIAACLVISCQAATAQDSPSAAALSSATSRSNLTNPATEQKIDALLHKMTLDEKVGQLVQYSSGQPTGPGTGRTDYNDMIQKGEIGSLFNITTARDANVFQHVAMEKSRLRIPLIYGLDVIHGYRTEFPIPLGMAATWDPDLVQRAARLAAREASASGIRWIFSPMIDIARDARWGRMVES
jgi:hypothetical protein